MAEGKALAPRRHNVLCALVADYIATHEPVGSKALVEKHRLGVSPATVRNDMADLEKEGYIYQPHTSAGRVPTEKGYREFVNHIATLQPLSEAQRNAIQTFLTEPLSVGDVMRRSVQLLSQITHHTAVAQVPSVARATLRHIELVPLSPMRILIVVIADSGMVEQHTIDIAEPFDSYVLETLRIKLNALCVGLESGAFAASLEDLVRATPTEQVGVVSAIIDALAQTLQPVYTQKLVVSGMSHLARSGPDFRGELSPIIEALEEQVALLRLFEESQHAPEGIHVTIGSENHHEALREVAVIASSYGGAQSRAQLGVIGPTRMDYARSMSAVRTVASYLSKILEPTVR
ncbi:heat-inducible transcriptional repressor HrcA [Boudabousia marimammalium]|uniref:Heat-inducible transcription repressor HrcA n=1 Tax=Boudabousia marimammalium TaxID=156892 RepID=A0A1Q5PP82_9ACTO|nr:heat-inducible transcriptional repressor HrcA [Boudabousia marimammalium]OKL49322.1 hypothetical protein BM477_04915 [Boudabousia marimammalium]